MRAGNGEGGTSMYRLSMAKGKRSKGKMHVKLEFDLYLSREELAALNKAVESHRAMQQKFGWKPDWDEIKELVGAVQVHIRDLRRKYAEEEKHAEFNGDIDEAEPVTAEIRGSEECRQVV